MDPTAPEPEKGQIKSFASSAYDSGSTTAAGPQVQLKPSEHAPLHPQPLEVHLESLQRAARIMELAEMRAITGKTSLKDWAAVGRISVLPFNANTVAIIRSAMAFAQWHRSSKPT